MNLNILKSESDEHGCGLYRYWSEISSDTQWSQLKMLSLEDHILLYDIYLIRLISAMFSVGQTSWWLWFKLVINNAPILVCWLNLPLFKDIWLFKSFKTLNNVKQLTEKGLKERQNGLIVRHTFNHCDCKLYIKRIFYLLHF